MVFNGVSKDEAPFFIRMSVQIYVVLEVQMVLGMLDYLSSGINGGMKIWLGISIQSVKVQVLCVISPKTSGYTVWVQARYDFKDKVIQKHLGLRVIFIH